MKVAIFIHGEEIAEGCLGHFKNSILDGHEFVLNVLVFLWEIIEASQDVQCFIFAAFENCFALATSMA